MNSYPLFVYGTLLRGQPNHYLLNGRTDCILPGWIEGVELYSMGTFPVLVEGHDRVFGEAVFLSSDPDAYVATMASLDRLEGVDVPKGLYRRELRPVRSRSGEEFLAWVYVGRRASVRDRPRIEAGDWVAHLANP